MSDTDGKIKIYPNSNRNKPEDYKPYVPQHQIHGKEPTEYRGAVVPGGTQIAKPNADNPRLKRPPLRQPYATAIPSPVGRGKGPVPNVGNNMEHTWSNVDNEVVDDLSGELIDSNEQMIDNNDFMTDQALGFQNGLNAADIQPPFTRGNVTIELPTTDNQNTSVQHDTENLFSIVSDLTPDSFLLIVAGTPVCSGPKEEIEEQAKAFLFGEAEVCGGNETPIDDIIILKRVKIKVGLFLE